MKKNYFFALVALFLSSSAFAQWIDFEDQTDQRIQITNISDNDNSNLLDDQEKDFAVADFDNDGFEDLIVVRKSPFSFVGAKTDLLLMNRNGVLVDETDIYAPGLLDTTDARDVIPFDVNNDDWVDVFIVSTFGDQPRLYINLGADGGGDWLGFENQSSSRLPTLTGIIQFCAGDFGDIDGDDDLDFYMVNYGQQEVTRDVLLINDGNGNFTEESDSRMGNLRESSFGTGAEIHDVDNDGDLDLVKNLGSFPIPPFNDVGTYVLFNNGDGTFTNFYRFPGPTPYMFTMGDLDDDGFLDSYGVDDTQDYINHITGAVQDQSLTVDNDLITATLTQAWGGNVKMKDLDGDGDLDVALASVDTDEPPCDTSQGGQGGARTFILFENRDSYSGIIEHPYPDFNNPWNIPNYDHDFIDLNNDGFMDIILGTCEGYTVFMQRDPSLSVDGVTQTDSSLSVFPNPSNGVVNVSVKGLQNPDMKGNLYDVTGKLLGTMELNTSLSNTIQVDLREYTTTSGIYFLQFDTGDEKTVTRKIIIQ